VQKQTPTHAFVLMSTATSPEIIHTVRHRLKHLRAALWKMQKRFDLVMDYPLS